MSVQAATSTEVLQDAVRELRALGISNASEVVRCGAAEMVRRSITAYEERSDVGPGWLVQVIRSGGPWIETPPRGPRVPRVEDSAGFLARRGAA